MPKATIILLTGKGHITETIAGLFPPTFELKKMYWENADLQTLTSNLRDAELLVLNCSNTSENCIENFKILKLEFPEKPFIVLHHYTQKKFAQAFLNMGAAAYLNHNSINNELSDAIAAVTKGKSYLSPTLL